MAARPLLVALVCTTNAAEVPTRRIRAPRTVDPTPWLQHTPSWITMNSTLQGLLKALWIVMKKMTSQKAWM